MLFHILPSCHVNLSAKSDCLTQDERSEFKKMVGCNFVSFRFHFVCIVLHCILKNHNLYYFHIFLFRSGLNWRSMTSQRTNLHLPLRTLTRTTRTARTTRTTRTVGCVTSLLLLSLGQILLYRCRI